MRPHPGLGRDTRRPVFVVTLAWESLDNGGTSLVGESHAKCEMDIADCAHQGRGRRRGPTSGTSRALPQGCRPGSQGPRVG